MTPQGICYVVIVSILIFGIAAIYIGVYLVMLASVQPIVFYILAPLYLIIVSLLVVSYYRSVCGSPGYLSPLYVSPNSTQNNTYTRQQIAQFMKNQQKHRTHKIERRKRAHPQSNSKYILDQVSRDQLNDLTQTGYCPTCESVKIPRSHHCKQCKQCIIRMDHHCPWIGHCVGKYNHKYFMLFLLYATIGLIITWVSILIDAINVWPILQSRGGPEEMTPVYLASVAAVMALFLSLAIGSLFIAQLVGLWQNLTTLESWVPGAQAELPFQKRGGWKQNLQEVMGQDGWWLLPTMPILAGDYRSQGETQFIDNYHQIRT